MLSLCQVSPTDLYWSKTLFLSQETKAIAAKINRRLLFRLIFFDRCYFVIWFFIVCRSWRPVSLIVIVWVAILVWISIWIFVFNSQSFCRSSSSRSWLAHFAWSFQFLWLVKTLQAFLT